MANVTPQTPSATPSVHTYAACAGGGDTIINAVEGMLVLFETTHTSDQTITVESQVPLSEGYTEQDKVIIAAAATDRVMWKITRQYIDADDHVTLTYTGVVGLTVAVFAR